MNIEPHWKEELAEISSRPDTDPYQIAINKIYNLLEGVADEELKSILCMAIWKQAIEPLVDSEMTEVIEWLDENSFKRKLNGDWYTMLREVAYTTPEIIELYNTETRSKKPRHGVAWQPRQ